MSNLKLVIANKAYSSWSLRPWLLMKQAGIDFEEIRIPLHQAGTRNAILNYSPAGRVPVLLDDNLTIWDSLAIAEYLAEKFPQKNLWPRDAAMRARARSIGAEMHSGFSALRTSMQMNVRKKIPGRVQSAEVAADIARIDAMWTECRVAHGNGGPFLFGQFCIADAMYAPVATRFRTYSVALSQPAQTYADHILGMPAMQAWVRDAQTETEVIAHYEI
ncbi:MAG: glutathione S-transferase family protein [Burkholderiales bacterium]